MQHPQDIFHQKKKRRVWPYVFLAICLFLAGGLFMVYQIVRNITPEEFVKSNVVQNAIVSQVGEQYRGVVAYAPTLLGFQEPKTYLFLFLNNTEMRPGGGFIGSYATIRINRGKLEVLKLEGIETLDNAADRSKLPAPPAILTQELKVDTWFMRDSNWDPDFSANAKRALDFYAREDGVAADQIDAVIAITADVLVEVMKLVGPVDVEGLQFDETNVTETLQYDVHYGYEDRDITFEDRKHILRPFFDILINRLQADVFSRPKVYLALVERLVAEKHIMAFSYDNSLQDIIKEFGADGSMIQTEDDYLMWNDANLAALKSDYAIERELDYSGQMQEDGRMLMTATMHYTHTGDFDWRTTRYRTNARLYVPEGSELVSAERIDETGSRRVFTPEISTAFGKTVFTFFHIIEPGDTASLVYRYYLPERLTNDIATGTYHLDVQKQPGLPRIDTTLTIDFGKAVTSADPAEPNTEWGDSLYRMHDDGVVDRQFSVGL